MLYLCVYLRVFYPLIQLSKSHVLCQFLEQNFNEDSTGTGSLFLIQVNDR